MESWQRRRLWRTLGVLIFLLGFLLYSWWGRASRYIPTRPIPHGVEAPIEEAAWQVTPLPDGLYLESLLNDLANADSSVDVAMYVIRPDEEPSAPVERILSAVAASAARGARVRIVLDRSASGVDRHDLFNRSAATWLTERQAEIRFDQPNVELHDKLVIIDGHIAYVGAHNWTKDALADNRELSLRIASASPVGGAIAAFDDLWGTSSEPGRVSLTVPTNQSGDPDAVLEDE